MATLTAEDAAFFENRIRPILVKHCYECHAADADDIGGKLLLDSRDGVTDGGESGAAVNGLNPNDSLIVQAHALRGTRRCLPMSGFPNRHS